MIRALLRSLSFVAACMLVSGPANAQLAIDRLWVDLTDKGSTRSDLVVRNESTDIYYITVVASEILNPGTADEERFTVADPEQLGLLVTPNRLIVRPGELRAIRVVSLNRSLSKDRIYRVKINPEIGELSYDQNQEEMRGLALKLLAAFDVLVTVRPHSAAPDLVARRVNDSIYFENKGTSNLLMLDGKVCPIGGRTLSEKTLDAYRSQVAQPQLPEDFNAELDKPLNEAQLSQLQLTEDNCIRLPGRRLYSGNIWPVVADDDAELRFMVRRNANEDLRNLTVRCSGNPTSFKNSDFCRIGGSEADAGAVASSPAPTEKEEKS